MESDSAQRLRDLGVEIGQMTPGARNMITDVPGVEVGHETIWHGEPGDRSVARTGVTAIWPRRDNLMEDPSSAGIFILSGTGEMTCRSQIEELGYLETPIVLTNTMGIGAGYDSVCRYMIQNDPEFGKNKGFVIPAVAECDDSWLNDVRGMHIGAEHVQRALDVAHGGDVTEGAVGAGTGMHCFQFKGGIGTSSRIVTTMHGRFTIGALVLTNFGRRHRLTFDGFPIGRHFPHVESPSESTADEGSGIVVIATDAPLNSHHLSRIAKRASLGLARTGSIGGNGSGELLIAFSAAEESSRPESQLAFDHEIDLFFEAAIDVTEESVLSALIQGKTVTGRDGNVRQGFPVGEAMEIMNRTLPDRI